MRYLTAIAVTLVAAFIVAPQPTDAPAGKPPCEGTHLVIMADAATPCDVTPPQALHLVYDATTHTGPDWGSDASLAAATADCLHYGGTPEWHGGDRMLCRNIDY